MIKLNTEIDTKKLEIAMRIIPKRLKYELGDAMDHISRKFLKLFRETRLQGRPGIKGRPHGIFTHFRRASILSSTIEGMGIEIFSDSKIARMHEEGAILKDPGGGKMAVPLSARTEMFTASGRLRTRYKRPSQLKNVVPIEFRGKTFLVRVKKKAKELLPLFVLKNKIRIRPRLGFYDTWASMQNIRINILNRAVERALKKG